MPDANDATPASAQDAAAADRLKPGLRAGWVWHATLETRAAGQWSVLAGVETVAAVALYWWIAWRFDTHLHLVTSVFIAPLLLLRSPESIQAGVQWFLGDESWPKWRTMLSVGAVSMLACASTYCLAQWLNHRWLPGLTGWALFGWSASIGAICVPFLSACAFAYGVAFAGNHGMTNAFELAKFGELTPYDEGLFEGFTLYMNKLGLAVLVVASVLIAGLVAAVIAVTGAGIGAMVGAIASALMIVIAAFVAFAAVLESKNRDSGKSASAVIAVILGPSYGAGLVFRSLISRAAATLRHPLNGALRLPENWRENNFLTDSFVPAELLPGIRETEPMFALDGLMRAFVGERDKPTRVLHAVTGAFFFLPAFLYRLNIKATAWFWWPLAYLLKPAPVPDEVGQQKEALCAPWTDPFELVKLGGSVVFTVASLVLLGVDLSTLWALRPLQALPLAAKVTLAVDWARYAPWHWAQLVIALSGVGMFWLAGKAVSNARNDNWPNFYQQNAGWAVPLMTGLRRVRVLATVALVVMGLGALLVEYRDQWTAYVPVPAEWLTALARFYTNTR